MSALNSHATGNPADASVAVRDLLIAYGSLVVLDKLSLDIPKGEFLVLLGPSGCGKSTLLNSIAGLLDITDGEIWISGKNVTWEEPKDRGIGMVFQSYALYPRMSVYDNMAFGLKIAGLPKSEIEERVGRAAKMLKLEPLLKRKPSELSGGQRQRVAIGRALVRNVDVFLFDEPLSNLDAQLRSELRVEIKKLHQDIGNTMIYVTHDQIEAMTLADRIAVMKGGIIQQLDDPHTIYNRPKNLFVAGFIGSPAMTFLNGKITALNGAPAVDVGGGVVVPLGRYQFEAGSSAPAAGTDVVLGVRPEHIITGSPADGTEDGRRFWTKGQVKMLEPTGADTILWTEVGGQNLTVRVDSDHEVALYAHFDFAFDLDRASLFDKASGDRL
ncbi:ABC transporter ATP-binding protein [Oryzibacter oryziterrae]|uniref:ABC transporter ATP-binding protein n=1 Tax=Oryzibacter oryziterrae TaxID=2766474 RepID=UPI001F18191D|nr:ABC transporter ATP-binding protein [Oryzibacter oryziterrae]